MADNCDGLKGIAGERIWVEVKQIFSYPSAPQLLEVMASAGVTAPCGLPVAPNSGEMRFRYATDTGGVGGLLVNGAAPATCVAAALNSAEEAEVLIDRIHASRAEAAVLRLLAGPRRERLPWKEPHALTEALRHELLLSPDGGSAGSLRPLLDEAARYLLAGSATPCDAALADWLAWSPPRFPVNGGLVAERWHDSSVTKGPRLRLLLQALRNVWVESGCQMDAEGLLAPEIQKRVSTMTPEEIEREPLIVPTKKRKR